MTVYSMMNNPEGDGGWFVHRSGLYFAGHDDVLVCRKHAGMNLQPVTTLDIEQGTTPQCFMCKGGPMYGLKLGIRRIVRGPIYGGPVTNPKYEEAFFEAAGWAHDGLLYKGRCPVCNGVILDDQLDCDPRGPAGEHAEVNICDDEGNLKLSICYASSNDSKRYSQANRVAFPTS
jgi:hypothetical protein